MLTRDAIAKFLLYCRYRNLAPKTVSNYAWALAKLAAWSDALPERKDDVMALIAAQQLADVSKHDLWRFLRRFYRWGSKEGHWPNATEGLEAPGVRKQFPRTLEEAEIDRLLASIQDRRDRAMVALPIDCGIRLSEIANLRWQDVHIGELRVDGKTGPRYVPLSDDMHKMLLGLGDGTHIWTGRKGPLTIYGVKLAISKSLARAGFHPPKAGPHMLRHTFGRQYMRGGGNLGALQRIMGHENIATTIIYAKMTALDLQEVHERFSPLVRVLKGGKPHETIASSN